MVTPSPTTAPGSTTAVGWMLVGPRATCHPAAPESVLKPCLSSEARGRAWEVGGGRWQVAGGRRVRGARCEVGGGALRLGLIIAQQRTGHATHAPARSTAMPRARARHQAHERLVWSVRCEARLHGRYPPPLRPAASCGRRRAGGRRGTHQAPITGAANDAPLLPLQSSDQVAHQAPTGPGPR
jgi:hypothetical protein